MKIRYYSGTKWIEVKSAGELRCLVANKTISGKTPIVFQDGWGLPRKPLDICELFRDLEIFSGSMGKVSYYDGESWIGVKNITHLRNLVAEGVVRSTTPVFQEGWKHTQPASNIQGLFYDPEAFTAANEIEQLKRKIENLKKENDSLTRQNGILQGKNFDLDAQARKSKTNTIPSWVKQELSELVCVAMQEVYGEADAEIHHYFASFQSSIGISSVSSEWIAIGTDFTSDQIFDHVFFDQAHVFLGRWRKLAPVIAERWCMETIISAIKESKRMVGSHHAAKWKQLFEEKQTLTIEVNKLREQARQHPGLDSLVKSYMADTVKFIQSKLNTRNLFSCCEQIRALAEKCRKAGYDLPKKEVDGHIKKIKAEFEKLVRREEQKNEQARIKAMIREEEKIRRELEKQQKEAEKEIAATEKELQIARERKYSEAVIEALQKRLSVAEARRDRAISQAQLTKAGHVYVISNFGSFGEGVFKIGMTRRLDPQERIYELGSASVPFSFDVHMMISSEDAPGLENAIHKDLKHCTVNKMKPRKEFFKTDIETIRRIVKKHHGAVEYVADPEAVEYGQSVLMDKDDADYIESIYSKLEEEGVHVRD